MTDSYMSGQAATDRIIVSYTRTCTKSTVRYSLDILCQAIPYSISPDISQVHARYVEYTDEWSVSGNKMTILSKGSSSKLQNSKQITKHGNNPEQSHTWRLR